MKEAPAAAPLPRQEKPNRARDLLAKLCPHADWAVVETLWERKLYRKLANYLWVEFLLARGSTRLWGGRPYWLTLDPSNLCQLHCPFCPTGANRGVRDKAVMPWERFEEVMAALGPCLIHMDIMNWGESLLNKRLPDMIALAKRHDIEVKLDANFNDVSEDAIAALILSGLDVLSLSVDGLSPETYGRYRAGGDFEKVLRNLRCLVQKRAELKRKNPWIIWQFLVFRHNEHEAGRVEEFARGCGADQASLVAPYLPNERGYLWEWMSRDARYQLYPLPAEAPPEEELDRARRNAHVKPGAPAVVLHVQRFQPRQLRRASYLLDLLRRSPQDLGFALGRAARILALPADVGAAPAPDAAPGSRRLCKWPWAGLAINPNGSVSPCCSVEDQSDDFGAFTRRGWSSLWNGSRYRAARRHVRRFAGGRAEVQSGSDHVCERCRSIGNADFKFPPHGSYGRGPARPAQERP
ncbi:MAG: radical SAM protein [Elusimicrobia bacterium]|nr:radical SAM protein [Elusimicrobiota bacterium]